MKHVINIHTGSQKIDLRIGQHKIDILGGWGVALGEFSISLEHDVSGQVVNCEKSFWPVQSYAFGKRARRIFTADVSKTGTYKVKFTKAESLRITHSNLFISKLLEDPIPNEKISVHIHTRPWWKLWE
jgi:hypothetical protein